MFRITTVLATLCLAVPTLAQLTEEEKKGIEETLFLGNMSLRDLNYSRRPFNDGYRLDLVNMGIDHPVAALDTLLNLHRVGVGANAGALLKAAREGGLGMAVASVASEPVEVKETLEELPEELREPVRELIGEVAKCAAIVRKALEQLSAEEKRTLIESLPQWATEEPSIKFEFVRTPQAPQSQILSLLAKVDMGAMPIAAERLSDYLQGRLESLRALGRASKWEGHVRLRAAGLNVVVGGVGDDTYRDMDTQLTLDLGGNDRYFGRAGAGPGYASLLIDLGGDDTYKVPDVGAGCGLLGIGLAFDLGGHDNFRGKSLCFGAGLAGVGLLYKDGGDDSYQSVALTQGFAQFGVGVLMDTRGNDLYEANLFAQGAARTQGAAWLMDRSGHDTYRAGGLILNSPLFKDVHYSFAQGFGMGYREDTGGISGGVGLLTDVAGEDAYIGETYCQAASYWFALGSLCDMAGNDTYRGYHYAQASAMHMTSAYLLELSGDDSYINNFGAAHAIGHDYGVGVLFDRAGSDVYAARDSRPGIGNANGLGLFVDAAGEDRYSGPPGVGNPARGTGSLGVFVDLDGPDQYRDGLADGQAAVKTSWGVGYDRETSIVPAPPTGGTEQTRAPQPGSLPRPSDDELAEIYRKATQWGVGTATEEVADNVNRLIGIGMPALNWMIQNRLPTANRLEHRAFVAVVTAIGDQAKEAIAVRVLSENDNEARNALTIGMESQAAQAAPHLPQALKRPALQRLAARAAGALGSKESVPDLVLLAANQDKLLALAAVTSLAQLKDPSTVSTAQALMLSEELPIRKTALGLVAGFPEALEIGKSMMSEADERTARIGIELLGAIGTEEALTAVGPALIDTRPGIRIQALLAMEGKTPPEFRQSVLDRRRDPDPLVRAIAARIDPGR